MIVFSIRNQSRGVERCISDFWDGISYPVSEGILSTGVKYEFHGEFNFNEFRQAHGVFWERDTGSAVAVTSYTEAAEAGQFYLSPSLLNLQEPKVHVEGESWVVAVRYCLETENWVVHYLIPELVQHLLLGEPGIYAINRSTGNVINFSRNRGSVSIIVGRGGWRRTLR